MAAVREQVVANGNITVVTHQGALSIWQSSGSGLPLVLLHGNSMSKAMFSKQMESPLAGYYRLIAMDLPGHGHSDDAARPASAYSLPGYARIVREALNVLGVERAVVFGWSLGGHVALELASSWSGVIGVALSGAPPVTASPDGIDAAFVDSPASRLLASPIINETESLFLARAIFGQEVPNFVLREICRCDGRSRQILFDSFLAGRAADERALVETRTIPIAVIDGMNDPFVKQDYLSQLAFAALWQGTIHRISGAGHAPFWEQPRAFNKLLLSFMRDMTRRANWRRSQPAVANTATPAVRRA